MSKDCILNILKGATNYTVRNGGPVQHANALRQFARSLVRCPQLDSRLDRGSSLQQQVDVVP